MLSAIFHFIKEKAINKRGPDGGPGRESYKNESENYHGCSLLPLFYPLPSRKGVGSPLFLLFRLINARIRVKTSGRPTQEMTDSCRGLDGLTGRARSGG